MGGKVTERSIKDWEVIFSKLYSKSDSAKSAEQIWIAVLAHTSQIGESIRLIKFKKLFYSAAHAFCWLCSFVNKCKSSPSSDIFSLQETLCKMVTLKYPLVCGHCQTAPCVCKAKIMDSEEDKSARYKDLFERMKTRIGCTASHTIKEWQSEFSEIYGNQVHILTLESIGFHLLEEAGEGTVAIRELSQLQKILENKIEGIDEKFLGELSTIEGIVKNYEKLFKERKEKEDIDHSSKEPAQLKRRIVKAKMDLIIEIADTFSWFCSILNKVDYIYRNLRDDEPPCLEDTLMEQYINGNNGPKCPTCKKSICACVFFP